MKILNLLGFGKKEKKEDETISLTKELKNARAMIIVKDFVINRLKEINDKYIKEINRIEKENQTLKEQAFIADILTLEENEMQMIQLALDKYSTNADAAKVLGISQSTLYRKIKKYNLKS